MPCGCVVAFICVFCEDSCGIEVIVITMVVVIVVVVFVIILVINVFVNQETLMTTWRLVDLLLPYERRIQRGEVSLTPHVYLEPPNRRHVEPVRDEAFIISL